jgi:hypothetical protein
MPDERPNATQVPANSAPRTPILVTGAHRTGTTWVGKMLAATDETAYISEPLNVYHRPGVFAAPVSHWYTYIDAENEAEFYSAYQKLLRFDYDLSAELSAIHSRKDALRMARDRWIFWTGRRNQARPLIKDPFAVFSIAWFITRLDSQVVVTVRHPAAFVSSLKRLDWPFDLGDLLAQPRLMHTWLEPFKAEIEAVSTQPEDIVRQGSLLWRLVYHVVAALHHNYRQISVVRHEDLSQDPLSGFAALYSRLGLTYSAQAQQAIKAASSAANPSELSRDAVHAVQLDSRSNLDNWKKRLEPAEIDRIRTLTEDVAARFYQDEDWR